MYRLRTLGLVLALVVLSVCAASAATLTENFTQSYALPSGGQFSLTNVNGEVIIEAWDRQTVDLSAVKTVQAENDTDAQDTLKAMRIEVTATAGRIVVETKMPHHDGILDWLTGHHINAKVDYHVRVPRHLELKIDTTNGSIEADHVQGQLRFETTNGHLTLDDLAGSVKAETTNGGIHANLNQVEGDLSFETTNGSITLSLPSAIRANLDASTTNGSIHSD